MAQLSSVANPSKIGTDVNNKTISQSVIEKLKLMRLDCTVMLCEKSGAFILRTKLCTCNMVINRLSYQ